MKVNEQNDGGWQPSKAFTYAGGNWGDLLVMLLLATIAAIVVCRYGWLPASAFPKTLVTGLPVVVVGWFVIYRLPPDIPPWP